MGRVNISCGRFPLLFANSGVYNYSRRTPAPFTNERDNGDIVSLREKSDSE